LSLNLHFADEYWQLFVLERFHSSINMRYERYTSLIDFVSLMWVPFFANFTSSNASLH